MTSGSMPKRRHLFLLLGIAALLYLPSLFGDFVFDDHYLIEQNSSLQSMDGLRAAFTEDYYALANPQYALGYYRPLSLLTHWLDWQLWGKRAFGHHLTNVLLHLACIATLYCLLLALFGNHALALIASMAFAVHPSHAGTVSFVSGRVDALATLFALLSLLFFCRRRALAAPSYFAALLSKEISVTLPALAFWKEKENGWRAAMMSLLPFVAALIAIGVLRFLVLGTPRSFVFGLSLETLPAYMRFLVFPPFQLYMEPSPEQLSLLPGLAALGLFAAGLWFLKDRRLAGWSLVWLITLLPVSGIVQIETALDERFLYFPSVSFSLLLGGWAVQYLRYRSGGAEPPEKQIIVVVILIAVVYAPSLLVRQAYWHNDLSLWSSAVETDPSSSRLRLRLGVALLEAGRPADAELQCREGLALKQESPIYTAALYTHLATALQIQEKAEEVEGLYRKSLQLAPDYYTAHFNLGLYYKKAGRTKEAIHEFKEALRANPRSEAARQNLKEMEVRAIPATDP